ncbi:MAG: ADP-ribosylglycohydrolase family protein, partial [Clostridia bacterium]
IALTIMAWLCGKDDFGRSLCIAAGCGEDADCIAGTLGATLGIVHGYDHIPEKWIAPMGMEIKTISINLGDAGIRTPKTVDELTERVLRLTPIFLGSALCDTLHGADGYTLSLCAPDALRHTPHRINSYAVDDFAVQLARQPFATYHPFTLFDVTLDYGQAPYIQEGVPFTLRVQVENNMRIQQWLTLRFHLPEGFSITPGLETSLQLEQYHGNIGRTQAEYTITPTGLTQARYDLVLELRSNGRHSKGLVPITLLTGHA